MKNILVLLTLTIILNSCKKFLDVGNPPTSLVATDVFSSDEAANGAIVNIYREMMNASAYTNGQLSRYPGLYADELRTSANPVPAIDAPFYQCALTAANKTLVGFWSNPYACIYECNLAIEQLEYSSGVNLVLRHQLLGEARFLRAFHYFYLVNLFGRVPKVTVTDYRQSSVQPAAETEELYALIIDDLLQAERLLPDSIPNADTLMVPALRAGKWAATAMLARVYLYTKEYALAEEKASAVIGSGRYRLEKPADVFGRESRETLLQLQPNPGGLNTAEANFYLPGNGVPPYCPITPSLYSSFEAADNRRKLWVGSYKQGTSTYYYPNKYKTRISVPAKEYNILLRLAEQYLVRAEARALQGKLYGAQSAAADLNTIRQRSGLGQVGRNYNQGQMMAAVEQERRVELFSEWGHRWFDLRRMAGRNNPAQTRADEVLPVLKPAYADHRSLFPIPEAQLLLNGALLQNPGY